MSNENYTLSPAKIELLSNVSGVYSSPFWDGMREVTGTLDTIRKRDIYKAAIFISLQQTGRNFLCRVVQMRTMGKRYVIYQQASPL